MFKGETRKADTKVRKMGEKPIEKETLSRGVLIKNQKSGCFCCSAADIVSKNNNSVNGLWSYFEVLYKSIIYHIPFNTFNKKPLADEIGHAFDAKRIRLDSWRNSSFILI